MSGELPAGVYAHLSARSLAQVWASLRARLERSGHAIRGTLETTLDEDAADRVAGLLGRPVPAGRVRLRLADLDAALRRSAAGRGLVPVVAALTGSPLRDRPAERDAAAREWSQVWERLAESLLNAGLAAAGWVPRWTDWLHRGGVLTRLGPAAASATITAAVRTIAALEPTALEPTAPEPAAPGPAAPGPAAGGPGGAGCSLGALASRCTGDAHGLDSGQPTAALVLRAAAIMLEVPPPVSAADHRLLWQRLGVHTDAVSGTVLTWALRPPGQDRWSAMMRERADQGLVTHLTLLELRRHDVPLSRPDQPVYACENPQVLQAAALAGVPAPLVCTSGNPAAAGLVLLSRLRVRYHGDFDWPGIAIAGRLFALGAQPWRMSSSEYANAVAALSAAARLPLTGPPQPTPWDPALAQAMRRHGSAVHEELLVGTLLADLGGGPAPP